MAFVLNKVFCQINTMDIFYEGAFVFTSLKSTIIIPVVGVLIVLFFSISTENVMNRFEAIDLSVKTVAEQEGTIRNAMEEQGAGSKQILEGVSTVNELSGRNREGISSVMKAISQFKV